MSTAPAFPSLSFLRQALFVLSLSILAAACDGLPPAADGDPAPEREPDACVPQTCDEDACGLVDDECGATIDCGPCRDEADVAQLMTVVDTAIDVFVDRSYMHDILPLDVDAIRQDAEETLFSVPPSATHGDNPALLAALGKTVRAFRNGHSAVFANGGCTALGGADSYTTKYGVCGHPLGETIAVSERLSTSPLDLAPGDVVTALNTLTGNAMTREILSRALCSSGPANEEGDRALAAGSLFAVLQPGDVLTVQGLDGETREVAVTTSGSTLADYCGAIPGTVNTFEPLVAAHLRDDGVAVVRLSRMILVQGEPGNISVTNEETWLQYIDNMIAQVKDAFDQVAPDATALVWDIRGNIGGASPLGFAIAEGLRGARQTPIARCFLRDFGTDPVTYSPTGDDYELSPDEDEPFAFAGPTALLIDDRAISAADYFALAVDRGTDVEIYGRPSAGAYGGGGQSTTIDQSRGLGLAFDPYRCNDPVTGDALETQVVVPDHFIEYAPADLAEGRDTVLEAAAAALLLQAGE